jgi:RNA polymerase sigma-70 factor (ECF subfamily)
VYRQVQMHRRSAAIRNKYVFTDETFEALAGEAPASIERDKAMSAALDKCLGKLNEKQRELIEQRYLTKGTLQDLAEDTGRTANALYKTLQRIRESLHHCICDRMEKEGFSA